MKNKNTLTAIEAINKIREHFYNGDQMWHISVIRQVLDMVEKEVKNSEAKP